MQQDARSGVLEVIPAGAAQIGFIRRVDVVGYRARFYLRLNPDVGPLRQLEYVNAWLAGLVERELQPAGHDASGLLAEILEAGVGERFFVIRGLSGGSLLRFRLKITMHLLFVARRVHFDVER